MLLPLKNAPGAMIILPPFMRYSAIAYVPVVPMRPTVERQRRCAGKIQTYARESAAANRHAVKAEATSRATSDERWVPVK